MKRLMEKILKTAATAVLRKYRPKIVGITGSVGKTSTKEAVVTVLAGRFRARGTSKNYNNEIGVPLTVVGAQSPGRSVSGWLGVIGRALWLVSRRDPSYPEILVLELGVDRPGDMAYLRSFITPTVGVITMIGPSHLEYFGTVEAIREEKAGIVDGLGDDGWAVLNYDSEEIRKIARDRGRRVITYGLEAGSDIRAREIRFSFEAADGSIRGINFKIEHRGSFVPVVLPQVVGLNSVYAALAAAAVGVALNLNLVDITSSLHKLVSPPGRMNLIKGIKETIIVDDTYNSSPQSCLSAFAVVRKIPVAKSGRKIAVLGDMLELGSLTETAHREVGRAALEAGFGLLITVGERARDIARGAKAAGLAEARIFEFAAAEEAGRFLEKRLKPGDLVLIKGSQGIRMEKAVKELMADPLSAPRRLVRQEGKWLHS